MATNREGFHNWLVQIPEELLEKLRTEAAQQERSATAQLIWILKERYAKTTQTPTGQQVTRKERRPPRRGKEKKQETS